MRHAGRETARAAAKPQRIVYMRLFDILALGGGSRHCSPLIIAPCESTIQSEPPARFEVGEDVGRCSSRRE